MKAQYAESRALLLQADQQTSVLGMVSAGSMRRASYSPYGHWTGQYLASQQGFNGQLLERGLAGYVLGGYRIFNTVLRRFHSPDSWSPFGVGGLSTYGYCLGDPVNRVDPSGHLGLLKIAIRPVTRRWRHVFYEKSIGDVNNIGEGAFIFSDKGGRRLNIAAHGATGFIGLNGALHDAVKLHRHLEVSGFDVKKYMSIRVLACRSADGYPSFIQDLADTTGVSVKGYLGRLTVDLPDMYEPMPGHNSFSSWKGKFRPKKYGRYDATGLDKLNYSPVVVQPRRGR